MAYMNDSVILRPLRRVDFPVIAEMIRRMWYAEPELSLSCARRLAMIDLHYSLSGSTSAMVAQCGDTVVGIITTHVDAHTNPRVDTYADTHDNSHKSRVCSRFFSWHNRAIFRLTVSLLPSVQGRNGLRKMLSLGRIDANLMRSAQSHNDNGNSFDGEVVLFLVDETMRGRGVGRMLFDHAMQDFRLSGVNRYFLFTDTRCNVGFYNHRGLTRLCSQRTALYGDSEQTFYLYEGQASVHPTPARA